MMALHPPKFRDEARGSGSTQSNSPPNEMNIRLCAPPVLTSLMILLLEFVRA